MQLNDLQNERIFPVKPALLILNLHTEHFLVVWTMGQLHFEKTGPCLGAHAPIKLVLTLNQLLKQHYMR